MFALTFSLILSAAEKKDQKPMKNKKAKTNFVMKTLEIEALLTKISVPFILDAHSPGIPAVILKKAPAVFCNLDKETLQESFGDAGYKKKC